MVERKDGWAFPAVVLAVSCIISAMMLAVAGVVQVALRNVFDWTPETEKFPFWATLILIEMCATFLVLKGGPPHQRKPADTQLERVLDRLFWSVYFGLVIPIVSVFAQYVSDGLQKSLQEYGLSGGKGGGGLAFEVALFFVWALFVCVSFTRSMRGEYQYASDAKEQKPLMYGEYEYIRKVNKSCGLGRAFKNISGEEAGDRLDDAT